MSATAFKMHTGPRTEDGRPIRPLDYYYEILVAFDDGREASLGWVSCFHNIVSEKILYWMVVLPQAGGPFESKRFKSKKAALAAAHDFLTAKLGGEP